MTASLNNAYITDLKYTTYGMAMFPFYTIRRTSENEFEVGISNDEFTWDAIENVENTPFSTYYLENPENPFSNINSSCVIVNLEEIKEFSQKLEESGVFEIDGFDTHRDLGKHVLDGGDGFKLALVLSDGRTITSTSTNTYPKRYQEVSQVLHEFFEQHSDFSRRYPKELPDSPIRKIEIKCSGFMEELSWIPCVRCELNAGLKQWAVTLKDRRGELFDENPLDIADYGEVEDVSSLPFNELLDFVKELNIIQYNPYSSSASESNDLLRIYIYFENDQELSYTTRDMPENYADFKSRFAQFVYSYYFQIASKN